jgi:hypothetical protein
MFDRIDVDVVDVTGEIIFITNGVLPVTPLPYTAFALGGPALGNSFASWNTARESRFDQPPTRGKVSIAVGHSPDRVKMIGQNNHRVDREWMVMPRLPKRCPQFVDMFRQQSLSSLREINSEEETTSNDKLRR